jgi:hypothetical protein
MRSTDTDPGNASPEGGGTPSSPSSATPDSPHRRFEEVYRTYTNCLQDAWLANQGRFAETNRDFLQRLYGAQLELQKEVQEANRKFSGQPRNESDAQLRAAAYREYVEAINAAFVTGWNRAEEIKREYRQNVEAARSDYVKSNDDCYRSLLRDLQSAWSGVDPANVDVQHLNLISHLLLAATYTAYSRLGPA